jgi:chromosome segregation ATPase
MGNVKLLLCLITICVLEIPAATSVFAMQSLADAARREAERRDRIERLGIEEKVIEENGICSDPGGNVSVFMPSEIESEEPAAAAFPAKDRSTLRRYRAKLQKLDKDIGKGETRLESLQDRLDSLKRKSLRIEDFKGFSRNDESRDRILEQIEALKIDLKQLRKERREVFDAGRKEDFLPGELDGKGIIP